MSERARFVLEWERDRDQLEGRGNMAALCRAFGVSRETGYKWVRRYLASGRRFGSLEDQSRRPKVSPATTPAHVEKAIRRAREMHPRWGAVTLRSWLFRRGCKIPGLGIVQDEIPAASTIGAILRRHNLTRPRRTRRRTPPFTQPFRQCDASNQTWCADFKGWFRTQDGETCYPLTIMDAFSRKLLRCVGLVEPNDLRSKEVFESAFREYGLPLTIRSDNGPPFASTGLGGLTTLSVWWTKLRIHHERIEPGKPQQNGRHERMHRTLKEETVNPPGSTIAVQQTRFDVFQEVYNSERPHQALDGHTPDELYQPSERRYPEMLEPLEYPGTFELHQVSSTGRIRIRKRSIFLGSALAGETVGLQWLHSQEWEVVYGGTTLGIIDLQNERVIGPKRKRAGRAPRVSVMSSV